MSIQENEILDVLSEHNFGMSDYQIQNYVIKSQVTNYRQIKQSLIELNARRDAILQIEVDQKRRKIEKKKIKYDLENSKDQFKKELLEIDLEEVEKDLEYAEKRLLIQKKEYQLFLDLITSQFETKEQLEEYITNPEEERKYWIARMGKQAAIDLLSTGRIGTGNMDSISMMSEVDQVQTLKVAIQYSGLMGVGIAKLQQEMVPYLQQLEKTSDKILPTFEGIEENLNIDLLQKLSYARENVQSSNQSEDL
jgi:hypothetical protein